jgi:hypothetical protein
MLYECINGERERDSDNFAARIMKKGVIVEKIWTFEVLGENCHFRRFQGVYLEYIESLEGFSVKRWGHMWNLDNLQGSE